MENEIKNWPPLEAITGVTYSRYDKSGESYKIPDSVFDNIASYYVKLGHSEDDVNSLINGLKNNRKLCDFIVLHMKDILYCLYVEPKTFHNNHGKYEEIAKACLETLNDGTWSYDKTLEIGARGWRLRYSDYVNWVDKCPSASMMDMHYERYMSVDVNSDKFKETYNNVIQCEGKSYCWEFYDVQRLLWAGDNAPTEYYRIQTFTPEVLKKLDIFERLCLDVQETYMPFYKDAKEKLSKARIPALGMFNYFVPSFEVNDNNVHIVISQGTNAIIDSDGFYHIQSVVYGWLYHNIGEDNFQLVPNKIKHRNSPWINIEFIL